LHRRRYWLTATTLWKLLWYIDRHYWCLCELLDCVAPGYCMSRQDGSPVSDDEVLCGRLKMLVNPCLCLRREWMPRAYTHGYFDGSTGPDKRDKMHVSCRDLSLIVPSIDTRLITSFPYDGIHGFPYAARSSMFISLPTHRNRSVSHTAYFPAERTNDPFNLNYLFQPRPF
jgi:hypothetical protein